MAECAYGKGDLVGNSRGDWPVRLLKSLKQLLRRLSLAVILIGPGINLSHAADSKWVKPFRWVKICPRIGITPAECTSIHGGIAGNPIEVTQTIRNATGNHTYVRVKSDDKVGFVAENDNSITSVDPAIEWEDVFGCAIHGHPQIGMPISEVLSTCWGKETATTTITTAEGVTEYRFYGKGRALRLKDGNVDLILEKSHHFDSLRRKPVKGLTSFCNLLAPNAGQTD
ncbi:hypothetical protein [Bradyrhizobium lablabi]|uniref:hypothetical protein n=1 Tax=Bradyrhizobium lablabi TaxID=722472 RepID=UPI000909C026|nr:hypothetical protein [Bradyrhizobium lablabi]SHM80716.1 hypothetical protein SAMN05444321_7675 [Bradyrhizobium lablabi]